MTNVPNSVSTIGTYFVCGFSILLAQANEIAQNISVKASAPLAAASGAGGIVEHAGGEGAARGLRPGQVLADGRPVRRAPVPLEPARLEAARYDDQCAGFSRRSQEVGAALALGPSRFHDGREVHEVDRRRRDLLRREVLRQAVQSLVSNLGLPNLGLAAAVALTTASGQQSEEAGLSAHRQTDYCDLDGETPFRRGWTDFRAGSRNDA